MSGSEWTQSEESAQRRRAAWGLGILALVAAIVVSLMVFFLGTSHGDNSNQVLPPAVSVSPTASSPPPSTRSAPATSTTPSRPRATPSTSKTSKTSKKPSSSARSSSAKPSVPPTTGRVSCPSGQACVAPGDAGNVMGALNSYRTAHGRTPALGAVSSAAQRCALGNGNTSSCPTSYFWEPVTGRDGQAVINKIAAGGDGASFLLDPHGSFELGWAYVPSSHLFECALVTA